MVSCFVEAAPAQLVAADVRPNDPPGKAFLHNLQTNISKLSNPAVEMVAALVAVQYGLPQALSNWMLAELGQRADLSQVSPLASATMKIGIRSTMLHTGVPLDDSGADFALIHALGRDTALEEARLFLAQLVQSLERLTLVPAENG